MIVVLSPHCDDAVLSLGAWISAKTEAGHSVNVVTVFGNDAEKELPLSNWDLRAGFTSSAEAAVARQQEDVDALAVLKATSVQFPFPDSSYLVSERDEDEIADAVLDAVAGASVILVPGFPLTHRDHRWLAGLVVRRFEELPNVAFYTEQPYAWWVRRSTLDGLHIAHTATGLRHFQRKFRALRCYRSQLPLLGGWRMIPRLFAVDVFGDGEQLSSWTDGFDRAERRTFGREELVALAAT